MFDDIDTTSFTDTDWAEWNKLKRAYENGGTEALSQGMAALAAANPHCYLNIAEAINPGSVSDAVKDEMAAQGISREDLEEIVQKAKRREN